MENALTTVLLIIVALSIVAFVGAYALGMIGGATKAQLSGSAAISDAYIAGANKFTVVSGNVQVLQSKDVVHVNDIRVVLLTNNGPVDALLTYSTDKWVFNTTGITIELKGIPQSMNDGDTYSFTMTIKSDPTLTVNSGKIIIDATVGTNSFQYEIPFS